MTPEQLTKLVKETPGIWASCKLLSINLEDGTVEIAVPPAIIKSGIHAGYVLCDLSGITEPLLGRLETK